MNPETQTTLMNSYLPKLIATILKAPSEQLKENDQFNAVEEGVYEIVPMQQCNDAGMKSVDLILVDKSLWIRHARKFDRGCVHENTNRRSKVRIKELYPLLNCSLQCHLSKL